MRGWSRFTAALMAGSLVCGSTPALAQTAPAAPPAAASSADDATTRGRNAAIRGQQLVKDEKWGDALAAFEEAAAARDAPRLQYYIAYCDKALGRYVAAQKALLGVAKNPVGLDAHELEDTKALLAIFDQTIARVTVALDPPTAVITVDGRPLIPGDDPATYLAGVAPPGNGIPMGQASFTVLLDPGSHLFRAVREGHQDALVTNSYRPGEKATLDLHLDVLSATVAIRSEPPAAIVKVDAHEVGVTPLEFHRGAGQYKLEVLLDHYETYKAALDLAPGQRSDLTAHLNPYSEPLTKKWWFWTGAAAIIAGGAVLTYFLTRPAPQPPPYDAGSANWLVHASSVRW
jgi:hypothetical protein